MDLKILHRRKARGSRGKGLKAGRRAIVRMSDDSFNDLIQTYPTRGDKAQWRHTREVRRILKLMRSRNQERPLVIRRGFRKSEVLDAVFSGRQSAWLWSWQRTSIERIVLKDFSFIDEPVKTIESLRKLAEAEAKCKSITIDFEDPHVLDISPYMVLGLIQEKMLPVVQGGSIRERLQEVIQAVDLNKFLGMNKFKGVFGEGVYPFKLRQRRAPGKSRRDNLSHSATSEERIGSQVADTINRWLAELDTPLKLSQETRSNILILIGEVLDDAKRHSEPTSEDGTWAIAGFMEVRTRLDGTPNFVCHLAIISPGASIFESLKHGPPETRDAAERYAERHRPSLFGGSKAYDEEALWTALSLQDGISRVPTSAAGSPGGFGMMTLIEMINALGSSSRPDEQPSLTVISGSSCVMVRNDYKCPQRGVGGHRILAFNPENQLEQAPEDTYVFCLPYRFPGTIVALRFYLDHLELIRRSKKDDNNA